jgi:hypothetical protein
MEHKLPLDALVSTEEEEKRVEKFSQKHLSEDGLHTL